MRRADSGFSLLDWALVLAGLALVATLAVVCWPRARIVHYSGNAMAGLKQLTSHEASWKQLDYDGNGRMDYWTRDVASFRCVHDATGRPLAIIDRAFAHADKAPGMAYPELAGLCAPKQRMYFQAMTTDQEGQRYVDSRLPLPKAKNVPAGPCTNASRFGFTYFPAVYGSDGVLGFIVNEDGIIWQKDLGTSAPVLDRKAAAPEARYSGWAQFGG